MLAAIVKTSDLLLRQSLAVLSTAHLKPYMYTGEGNVAAAFPAQQQNKRATAIDPAKCADRDFQRCNSGPSCGSLMMWAAL